MGGRLLDYITHVILIFILLQTFFVCWGCNSQHVVLNRAIIRNETRGVISQIKVIHTPNGKFGEVHSIHPKSSFEVGFFVQPMRGEKAVITRTDEGGRKHKVEIILSRYGRWGLMDQTMILIFTNH